MNGSAARVTRAAASAVLENGTIAELVYDPMRRTTAFAVCCDGKWNSSERLEVAPDEYLRPFSPKNNLIANEAILLPSEPQEYSSESVLIADIREFIRRYTDLSERFEHVAAAYVLLSWLYDVFNELPYLRLRGDFGTGKTRALLTLGSISYKPFFASGASTTSPIFHTLDAFRGTLVLDEADFRLSDERADIVKILNNGNVRGIPVLRTMMSRQREFNPQAFQVFGPKIIATRGHYEDKALESRFLTEEMQPKRLRSDIPINLPPEFKSQAALLRNKLLCFRARTRSITSLKSHLIDRALEPRLNQILLPLLSVISDESMHGDLRAAAGSAQVSLISERAQSLEAQVLESLAKLMHANAATSISVGEIAADVQVRVGAEYDRSITSRWIGSIVRKRLQLQTYKTRGVFVVPIGERSKIRMLCDRYGIELDETWEKGTEGQGARVH